MPGAAVTYAYITFNDRGRATVSGTRHKVTMVARDHVELGMTPQQIHEAYPDLSLSEIHAALAYYYDHRAELDAEIEAGEREAERVMREIDASGNRITREELERRLREKGLRA